MDEETDEGAEFSATLFNKYGKVKPHIIEEGYRNGTGCWGKELNSGELVYIFYARVDEQVSPLYLILSLQSLKKLLRT